jgi:hypothetical protein
MEFAAMGDHHERDANGVAEQFKLRVTYGGNTARGRS